jgi:prepilin-type N-terminal cleavage/methylation domain-containing protein
MTSLQAYLQNPRTRKLLSKKPGSAGFSLIELVVVVAVLAVLVAVALPNFTLITHKAKVNQGKNALVTAIKECKVTEADSGNPTHTKFTVEGFSVVAANNTCAAGFAIVPATANQYATFRVSAAGTKLCAAGTTLPTGVLGCTTFTGPETLAETAAINARGPAGTAELTAAEVAAEIVLVTTPNGKWSQ